MNFVRVAVEKGLNMTSVLAALSCTQVIKK